jgi:protein TonB
VRLSITVSPEGNVTNISAINGHPLLVPAAMEAVRQYTYKPTLLNGNPIEVVSDVALNFTLPKP